MFLNYGIVNSQMVYNLTRMKCTYFQFWFLYIGAGNNNNNNNNGEAAEGEAGSVYTYF